MAVVIPVIAADGARSTVTLPDPVVTSARPGPSPAYWSQWPAGPPTSDAWFPLAAWLPGIPDTNVIAPYANFGAAIADAGMNTLLGTWSWLSGPGRPYLALAKSLGLKAIASVTSANLPDVGYLAANPDHADVIIGWQLGDEFDWKPWPANGPTAVHNMYLAAKAADPSRPIHINWTKHMVDPQNNPWTPETGSEDSDLRLYQASCDMTSFDDYAYTDPYESVRGAWRYGSFVDAMRRVSPVNKPMWGFVETSRPNNQQPAITPDQMTAAIWNMIVHGARGIMFFNHDFGPAPASGSDGVWGRVYYDRAGGDAIIAALKKVNGQILSLAPVLNSPQLGVVDATGRERPDAWVSVSSTAAPVDVMVRQHGGRTYVFAQASGSASLQNSAATTATFTLPGAVSVAVSGESRSITASGGGVWQDTFAPYQLHVYVI